jgi:hypothetical protein
MMTARVVALALLLLVPAPSAGAQTPAPATEPPAPIDKPCPPGATITMDLSAGGYVVRAAADPRLRVRWTTRDPAQMSSVYAKAETSGSECRLAMSGPSNGFMVTIDVPSRSNVNVSLSAGDFSIDALDGSVDVSAWAGKMQVGLADPSSYYAVYASVTAGQIRAEPFGAEKGGLLRSFSWEGKGRHSVRVRLTAGDIILGRATGK